MKIAIIQFPGTNCETESLNAVRKAGMTAEEFFWNQKGEELENYDGFFIIGGFSYEDRSRSGIISALDPLIKYVKKQAEKGKPVLGVCNGAQVLVESGLVPGLENYEIGSALAVNQRIQNQKILGTGFYNAWINIKQTKEAKPTAFTKGLDKNSILNIPIAHGEGRFLIPEDLLDLMKKNGQTVFQYCDESGNVKTEFPTNPNGAVYNLAGISNPSRNVLAIMPHPERSSNGDPIFSSMKSYIQENKNISFNPEFLDYKTEKVKITNYQKTENSTELNIEYIITDNEAVTVETTLQSMGIDVKVSKLNHWEIDFEENVSEKEKIEILEEIKKSDELFNSNKERVFDAEKESLENQKLSKLLVRYTEDFVGQSKTQTLKNSFKIEGLKSIKKGIVWNISGNESEIKKAVDSRIFFNQFSQKAFWV